MKRSENTLIEANADRTGKRLKKSRYHHGDLRAGLIEATRRLVEEKGPDGFSVSDACRLAGVSTAAPYKHFKDKNEMIVAMVLEGMVRFRSNILGALEGIPEATPERITAIGREYVNFALRENGIFRLKFGGFTDRLDDPRLQRAGQATFDILLHEVATCLGESEVTDDVRQRGFMLWSFVHGLSFLLVDKQLATMGGESDRDHMLSEIARRLLTDRPVS
ncbi:MAG: TetR/AcrR family transcriptional regulator [Pseudomonadota bacterium]